MHRSNDMYETGQIPDHATVADRLAIFDVLVRHSRGVDCADTAMWWHAITSRMRRVAIAR